MSAEELSTARLRLRRWRPEDEEPMAAINRDPAVTEYLNRPVGEAAVAAFLPDNVAHWEEHGFGVWALEPREGPLAGQLIGFAGVAHPAFLPEVASRTELGWRLAPAAWGRGYATEAALAARDHAFDRLGLPELISIVHPENFRSRRVAEKLGMTIERRVAIPARGREADVWQLSAPASAR